MVDDVDRTSAWLLAEAIDLRKHSIDMESLRTATPQHIRIALLDVRARLDRIEEILSNFIRLRGATVRQAVAARHAAGDAWDAHAVAARRGDYEGAKERYAQWSVATLDEQRSARQAEKQQSVLDEAVEIVRLVYKGLDATRYDLHVLLRSISIELPGERDALVE